MRALLCCVLLADVLETTPVAAVVVTCCDLVVRIMQPYQTVRRSLLHCQSDQTERAILYCQLPALTSTHLPAMPWVLHCQHGVGARCTQTCHKADWCFLLHLTAMNVLERSTCATLSELDEWSAQMGSLFGGGRRGVLS